MGRITASIKVENAVDWALAQRSPKTRKKIRRVTLEALIDTGASLLCLSKSVIAALGLERIGTRHGTTANGRVERSIYGSARLTLMDRTCTVDVIELPENTPALLGYIPLENLDLVPDPTKEILRPAHGDEIVLDLY